MEYKLLNDGNKIPIIGFGTFRMKGEECINAVISAIKAGYRHIDTAESYGNEAEVGVAIAYCIQAGIVKREDLFITTKLNHHVPNSYEKTFIQFENSLQRLGLDYVDLYLIHYANVTPDSRWKRINSEDWKAFEELQAAGKIRSIGVSNFLQHHLEELLKTAKIMPAVNQLNLNPTWQQKELVKYCEKLGILCSAWAPLVVINDENRSVMESIAQKYHRTPAQISLRWSVQKGFVPLVKSSKPNRILENLRIFDFTLEENDMKLLETLLSHAYGHDSYPDATYRIWSLFEELNNKNILTKKTFKLFNLIPLFKTKFKKSVEKVLFLGFIPVLYKKIINETSSKVFLFGFINIGSELNKYKYVERVKLLPRWDKPEPKLVLPKIDYFNERVYKRILNSFKFQNKKNGKNYIKYLKLRKLFTGKVSIPSLDVHLTTACTLKCKDCSHKIPYYKLENHHAMTLEEYKQELNIILQNVDKIYSLLLLGGEPLLHKNLAEMIKYAEEKKQIQNIFIVTNGTVIPSAQLINTVKKAKKTSFLISNYSKNKGLTKTKTEEIISLLERFSIKYFYQTNAQYWRKQPEINLKNNSLRPVVIENNFAQCEFKNCTLWSNGKIYPCAYAKFINDEKQNQYSSDFIDLHSEKLNKHDFIKFYRKKYFNSCECCEMTHYGEPILPAVQIETKEECKECQI